MHPQQSIEAVITKLRIGSLDQRRLGPKGNTQPGLLHHHLVIGAIADGENICLSKTQFLARVE